jgi:hypothetical protein
MTTKKTLAKGKNKTQKLCPIPQNKGEPVKEAPAPIFDDKTKSEQVLIFKDAVGNDTKILSVDDMKKKLEVNRITFNQFLNLSKDELFKRNRFFYAVPK